MKVFIAAAEIHVVGVHLHEGEDRAAALQEAGTQEMVDALGPAGGGARRIEAAAGELGAQLLVVQDEAVAVVRHGDLVSGLAVDGACEVAADPRGQAHAGVGARRELRPIQSAEGGVFPVQVGAAVGAQKCICHSDLKDAESRGALQVHRLAYVNSKSSSRPAARFRLLSRSQSSLFSFYRTTDLLGRARWRLSTSSPRRSAPRAAAAATTAASREAWKGRRRGRWRQRWQQLMFLHSLWNSVLLPSSLLKTVPRSCPIGRARSSAVS